MSSVSSTIQQVFNEPACAKNANKTEAERKKGCTKQLQPGGAAGGCAFDGAKIALQPLTDVAHLVHGPIACEGNSWDNRGAKSSGSNIWRTGFTTDINETRIFCMSGTVESRFVRQHKRQKTLALFRCRNWPRSTWSIVPLLSASR